MKRNDFIKNISMFTAGSLMLPDFALANHHINPTNVLSKIGVQLFSVPSSLESDFEGTMSLLTQMGFKEIELFGPYPFSAASAKERWKAITPMLGFSGSGFFGKTEEEVKAVFSEYGLSIPAMHTDLDTLETGMKDLGKSAQILGAEYVVLPAIPEERRKTPEDYKKMADVFNSIGKQATEVGLKFAYHNHGYGFSEIDGTAPLHYILDGTDPELVFFEMDLFWTVAGRADPISYLENYPGRYHLMHVKDMIEKKTFSGDGGDPAQWIELFPNMTSAGDGALDLKSILPAAIKNGVQHFFVEQDMVQNPEVVLKKSVDYLTSL